MIFGGIYFVLNLPLGYYSGFILPHRFDQSNQKLKDWIIDQLKGLAIGAPLGLTLLLTLLSWLTMEGLFNRLLHLPFSQGWIFSLWG